MNKKFVCHICKDEWDRVGPRLLINYIPNSSPNKEDRVVLCDYCSDIITEAMARERCLQVTTEEVDDNG